MPSEQLLTDDLLDAISLEQPAGANLRWAPEWDRVKEARRADNNLSIGNWKKKSSKSADWRQVEKLATDILRTRSKDLQIALWLTEAELKLHGFQGLSEGFRIVRGLMIRFWDNGLFPPMEDGPSDRSGPIAWLNDKLVDAIVEVPITARSDQGDDYGFIHLKDARHSGSESSYKSPDGEIDPMKKRAFDEWVAEGNVSLEMFQAAVKATTLEDYEKMQKEFEGALEEFSALEKVIDEKFGEMPPPSLSDCRNTLRDIQHEISEFVEKKRRGQPAAVTLSQALPGGGNGTTIRVPGSGGEQAASKGSWAEAEQMIRSGKTDAGLAAMARLALAETTGRSRFQRKLLLAEVCLATKRNQLARTILEELAEQIDEFKLESWESSELVGAVWSRLHRLYKQSDTANEDEARKLFDRLCRLDPWQALSCGE